jgi:hypothetical protein
MPVYDCYRGHAEGIALEKAGCFVTKDLRGRDWFCFQSSLPTLAGVDRDQLVKEKAAEMGARIQRLWGLGLRSPHSACTVVECPGQDDLPRLLAESKDPEDEVSSQGQP